MDTKQQFSKLYNLLQRQEQVIEQLISTSEEQTQYLRCNDTKSLQPIVEKQEVLSSTLNELEIDRVQLQQDLERKLGLPAESSLNDLALYAGEADAMKLNNIKASLQKNAERLKEINSLNQALAGQALQFTNIMLNLLQPRVRAGYTKDGNLNNRSKNSSRLNKSV